MRLLTAIALIGLSAAGRALAQAPAAPPAIRVDFVAPAPTPPRIEGLIFADDFAAPGDLKARYWEYVSNDGSFVPSPGDGYAGRGTAMKCQFAQGQVSAGSLKVLFGRNPFNRGIRKDETFREIYWRVYVKHEPGWEGNPAKLARATCMAGTNWSQGFIAHVWGGKGNALCIDPASGIRDGKKVSERYNDFANLRWLGNKSGPTQIFATEESGRWVCVEAHVRLNTPGQKDGVFELWVDGNLEAAHYTLDWHGTWDEYAINAFFLENYWNKGSVKRQARWMDDLAISTQRVGPVVAGAVPSFTRTPGECAAWETQAAADIEGKDVVWSSKPAAGQALTLNIDAQSGTFAGEGLKPGRTYWLRVRQKGADGAWSAWSAWHAPFVVAGAG